MHGHNNDNPGGDHPPADRNDVDPGQNADDVDTHKSHVTFFKTSAADTLTTANLTLLELRDRILAASAPTKAKLPWLKLAIFGKKRTVKKSMRHNANVEHITGVELDYDGGVVGFDAGVEMVRAMRIKALVYTSPSHTPAKPKWRVIAPTSKPCPPELRAKLVARVNGFLGDRLGMTGGILEKHAESFTLSQSYYYGRAEENLEADHRVEVFAGDFIDKRDDLYKYQAKGEIREDKQANPFEAVADENPPKDSRGFENILAEIGDGEGLGGFNEVLIRAVGSYVAVYKDAVDSKKLKALLRAAINKAPKNDSAQRADSIKRYLSDHYLDDIIASAVRKFAELPKGVKLDDFVAHMEAHTYIFIPTRSQWPAASVNARIKPVALLADDGSPIKDARGKTKHIPPSEWLDQNKPVEQMTWAPGEPMLIKDRLIDEGGWFKHVDATVLNLYRPPAIVHGDPGDVGPWLNHVRRVYPDDASHIINYMAYPVQKPQEKINHALMLAGPQGIGKDTLLEPLKQAVGPWNFKEVSPQNILESAFNGYLKAVVLRINEAADTGESNRFKLYEQMKTIAASPPDVHRVNEKNLKEHYVLNCNATIITSNHKTDGIYLPSDDRRHYVAWSDARKEDFDEAYWDAIYDWYKAGGDRNVAAYLATLDLKSFNPKKPPPQTAAFWAIVDANVAPEETELSDVLEALGNPDAVTLDQLEAGAQDAGQPNFGEWISDRKNRRAIPHKLHSCEYVPVRNPDATKGLWQVAAGIIPKAGGKEWTIQRSQQTIYAKKGLGLRDQIQAARALILEAEEQAKEKLKQRGGKSGGEKS